MQPGTGTENDAALRIRAGPVPFRRLLGGLFFYPHTTLLFLQQQQRWQRPLRTVVFLAFGLGTLVGLAKLPAALRRTDAWAAWVGNEVKAVWVQANRLQWEQPQELPATTRHRGWRIDFMAPGPVTDPAARTGPELRGFWVQADAITLWLRSTDGLITHRLMGDGRVAGVFALNRMWPEGQRFEGPEIRREVRRAFWHAVPFLLLQEGLALVAPAVLYALLFSCVPFVFRSPMAAQGFGPTFCFHLYAGVPPLVVTAVYAAIDLPSLRISTIFVSAYALYLLFIFYTLRRAEAERSEPGPPR